MAMTYTSLLAPKGTSGSIANWVGYSKLDLQTILDEAQSLIYQTMRVREMRTIWTFGMAVGQCDQPLPARFLDPIGRLFDVTNNSRFPQKLDTDIMSYRSYDASLSGSFAANPFTTAIGLSTITVVMANHGLNQGSTMTIAGAVAVDVFNLNGTWPVTSIIDANTLVIDTVDTQAASSVTGGGASATWTANNLDAASPSVWAIWDEQVKFDSALDTACAYKLLCFRSLPLLSTASPTNFLTSRYPMLIRKATQASAADFMKDDTEYQKALTALNALIMDIAAKDDMSYRGAEFGTDTPYATDGSFS